MPNKKLILMFKALEGELPNYITNNIISYINIEPNYMVRNPTLFKIMFHHVQNIKTRASFFINFIYMIFPGAIRTKMYTKMFMLIKLYGELGWDSLQNRRKKQTLILMFKALEGELPNMEIFSIASPQAHWEPSDRRD
jgi:hypothetical protein